MTGPGLPDIDAEGPDAITQCSMNASTRFPRIGTGELRVCERTRAWSLSVGDCHLRYKGSLHVPYAPNRPREYA